MKEILIAITAAMPKDADGNIIDKQLHSDIINAVQQVKNIAYEPVLGTVDYEYEHLFTPDENERCPIEGWWPIATDRIKQPERITEYIERGILRRIKPQ
jgi:hypothetical protein